MDKEARRKNAGYDGFAFKVTTPHVKLWGEKRHRWLLIVARDLEEATSIARRLMPSCEFDRSGPDVLARARALDVQDGGSIIDG